MKKLFAILISIFLVVSPSCAQGSKSAQTTSFAQTTSTKKSLVVFRNDLVARAKNPAEVKQGVNIVYPNNVRLNSGYEMPIVGLGTWTQNDTVAENSVYIAIKNGYRLIDTAAYYGNEVGVGKGVRRAIAEGIGTRKEIFVTSKVVPWGTSADYEKQIDECNKRLGLEYIDLMLIHQRGSGEKELYRAIEKKISDGTVKSLGISNYYTPREFDEITKGAKIMPAVIQNENHIFYQNTELQKYVAKFGTIIESYYPFGGRGHTRDSLENKTISEIAKSHGKTSAQIILRWHIQAGYITIPGSQNESHIKENFSVWDFELTADEMKKISALNTGRRYENW